MRVKDLIKELSDFNPNAELNNICVCWAGDDCAIDKRSIEQEKVNATKVVIFSDCYDKPETGGAKR